MSDKTYLDWPFFDVPQRRLALELDAWAVENLAHLDHGADVDALCRDLVARLGAGGWLRHCVPAAYGGASEDIDSRSLCIARETLARHEGLADFAFAMQGLGSGAISIAGSEELKRRYLPRVARGESIAAFALSEPDAGSDVGAMSTSARREGEHYVLDGEKTWISNGGIADFYCVFARTGEGAGGPGRPAVVVAAAPPRPALAARRGRGRPRPQRFRRRCRHARPRSRRAHRADRAASAGRPAFSRLPRECDAAPG